MGSASKLILLLAAPFPHLYRRSSALCLASLSPAAASVARSRPLLSAASRALSYLSANPHSHAAAAAKEALTDPSPGLSAAVQASSFSESTPRDLPSQKLSYGDWICPKCSYINPTKNNKCLECTEQPKRVWTDRDWECPQCDFCLVCNCKHPGDTSSAPNTNTTSNLRLRSDARLRRYARKKTT